VVHAEQFEEMARKKRINLKKPFEDLPKKARDLLLEGNGDQPGILGILEDGINRPAKRTREMLTDYMSPARCPSARAAAAAVEPRGAGARVSRSQNFTALSCRAALMTVRNWEFGEREQQIAGRVVDEIRRRLEFLSAVGLDYLSLDRSAATLSGGEAQRIRWHANRLEAARRALRAGRAVDRSASARQRAATRNPRRICAIWATRCWWWSTTPKPSSAPIT
jgi:excinuclease ABC subunit A